MFEKASVKKINVILKYECNAKNKELIFVFYKKSYIRKIKPNNCLMVVVG